MTMVSAADAATAPSKEAGPLIEGCVSRHPKGFGFLREAADYPDLFLPAEDMSRTLPNDRVRVRVELGADGRPLGRIVEVLSRSNPDLVGRFCPTSHGGFVKSLDPKWPKVYVPHDQGSLHVAANTLVRCRIMTRGDGKQSPTGAMLETWASDWTQATVVAAATHRHRLTHGFSQAVEMEAAGLPTGVRSVDAQGRVDLRAVPLMTIDGEDSKDFDDAVWAMRDAGGWRLLVAIADVSHYVTEGSALDQAAAERATSVYLPGTVLPMLPEALSNGLCSLNSKVDRLCLVCDTRVATDGSLGPCLFYPALMHSQARLTYTQATAILEGTQAAPSAAIGQGLSALNEVYEALAQARARRGSLEFESSECRIEFHEGKVAGISRPARLRAHRLIEECMLAANVQAAQFLLEQGAQGLYRLHELPQALKVADAQAYLKAVGADAVLSDAPSAGEITRLLAQTATHPQASGIAAMLRRLPGKAIYGSTNSGHFGLGLSAYAHFTSPIRRYPDVLVHRAIKAVVAGQQTQWCELQLQRWADQCNERERLAVSAERECVERHRCVWLQEAVGEVRPGTIEGATPAGLFVQLNCCLAQGLVGARTLQALGATYDAVRRQWSSADGNWALGQPLVVKIDQVSADTLTVDFQLA